MNKRCIAMTASVLLTLMSCGANAVETASEVRFDGPVSEARLSELVGAPVTMHHDGQGVPHAALPDVAVRRLAEHDVAFEVLWTHTELSNAEKTKSQGSISATNSIGFPINFANPQTLHITNAPANAVVTSVTIRVKGMAAYADLCWFQLRDAADTRYTLPKWYDEIWFDHTVSGITAFNGRPVNQPWTLWAQGSNTAGERVDQWWITIYYQTVYPPHEGEWEWAEEFDCSGDADFYFIPCGADVPMEIEIEQLLIDDEIYVLAEIPIDPPPYNACGALQRDGCPIIRVHEATKRIELDFTPPLPIFCIQVMEPQCSGGALIGPLTPGQWRFLSVHDGSIIGRPVFDLFFTVDPVEQTPSVYILGRPNVEVGSLVTLRSVTNALPDSCTFQWYKDGEAIPGENAPQYVIPQVDYDHAGLYRLMVLDEDMLLVQSTLFPLNVLPEGSLPAASLWTSLLLTAALLVAAAIATRRISRHRTGTTCYIAEGISGTYN